MAPLNYKYKKKKIKLGINTWKAQKSIESNKKSNY
jgi:hypothetical protein